MANYKIKILQIAQDDMKAIVAHIRLEDPDAAIKMYEKIKASLGKLANFPLIGPVPLDKKIAGQGYRMIVVDPYKCSTSWSWRITQWKFIVCFTANRTFLTSCKIIP